MTGNPDDYYYTDDNGNLIRPGRRPGPADGTSRYEDGTVGPGTPPGSGQDDSAPPAAAGNDFLEQATGRENRRDDRRDDRRDPDLRGAPPPPGGYRNPQRQQGPVVRTVPPQSPPPGAPYSY